MTLAGTFSVVLYAYLYEDLPLPYDMRFVNCHGTQVFLEYTRVHSSAILEVIRKLPNIRHFLKRVCS